MIVWARKLTLAVLLVLVFSVVFWPIATQADAPYDDVTPNSITFTGRRGVSYTASWDPATYEINFSTPDGRFPWDWISFVGHSGVVALNGYPDVGTTLAMSDPNALAGAQPGDLMRIKGHGILGLAHLTKVGLVIGSGSSAQRAWFSSGTIDRYTVAPHYVGYRVHVLGRTATVRVSSLNPQSYVSVGLVEVTLDDPSGARLVFASDLEPVMDYSGVIEFHTRNDTQVTFDSTQQAVVGRQGGTIHPVYVYSDQPLLSWSGNNLTFDQYLAADTLDGALYSGNSDGRIAISTAAQSRQYFYVGSQVLASAVRTSPTAELNALYQSRLAHLNAMPTIDSLTLPRLKFVNLFSNLILSYLVNPNGNLFYSDKGMIYATDSIMPTVVTPHILPPSLLTNFEQGLTKLASQQYGTTINNRYGFKLDTRAWANLPSWYGGNLPDIVYFKADMSLQYRENYSDAYVTAEFINAVHNVYQANGNLAFVQSMQPKVTAAVGGLQAFDLNYDAQRGQDGNLFPNLLTPMGDLGLIQGEYPGESAQTIYAYEDAADLYRLYGMNAQADALLANSVAPMRAAFDAHFWDAGQSYFMPRADANSSAHPAGSFYTDRWVHTLFVPLRGDVGTNRLASMLNTLFGPAFWEPTNDVHWLAKGSESFATPGRWNLSTSYTNGYGMEGGYLVLPNVIPPLGYYKLNQVGSAETYANIYLNKWLQYGPHETLMEWNGQMPGRVGESSLYIEAASGTTWLVQEALGLKVDGANVTIAPKLSGRFTVRNLNVTSQGRTAVINYARDAQGQEWIQIVSNDGLNISAPQADPQTPDTPTATATATKTATATATHTATATATKTATATATNTSVPPTATHTATATDTATAAPPAATPTATATGTLVPATATHTATATYTTAPPAATPTATATGVPTTPAMPGSYKLYISPLTFGTIGSLSVSDEDIVVYDPASGTWTMHFDGSDVGLGGSMMNLDAFSLQSDGSVLLSTDANVNLPVVGWVDDSDIVRFIPTSLGENTAGTYEWYFDASDVGLSDNGEDIDALAFSSDGQLLASVIGVFSAPGAAGDDESLYVFEPTQLGPTTSGAWSMYFDGADAGLNSSSSEDLNGAWVDPDTGEIYLTTLGDFTVPGASGTGADIFICTPLQLGNSTICTYRMFFDGSDHGLGLVIDGIDLELSAAGPTPTATAPATATNTPVPPTPTSTATNTPVPPTATHTATATNTPIPPTATATATATSTTLPPTASPTATATNTSAPATPTFTATPTHTTAPETATPTATATNTPAPATPTFTATQTPTTVPATPTATATSTPIPPTATATPTNTPAQPTATPTATATNTPIPPTATSTQVSTGSDRIYASLLDFATVGGVAAADEDILVYDLASGVWTLYFDGSDVGLGDYNEDVNAFSFLPDGTLLLSFSATVNIPNFGWVHSTDIVRFIPIQLGDVTDGTFEWYFNGLDVGLDEKGEVIDAIAFTPDGKLLISAIGGIIVPGVTANDEDLAQFDAAQLGQTTAGTWSLYFDGSDVGLGDAGSEEITGAWIDPDTGEIYLSTLGVFSVPGAAGDASDILICTPLQLGSTTACSYRMFFDGSAHGLSGLAIDGMDLELNAGSPAPTATATATATAAATATATATSTPIPPTATFTATNTPAPSTPTATATATPLPATPTPTATSTPTGVTPDTPTPTATATSTLAPATATATATATDTPDPATATPTATATPPPSGAGDVITISPANDGSVAGIAFSDEDILTYDTGTGVWSLYFDGSDVGLGDYNEDVNAFSFLPDGTLLLSFSATVNIPNFGWVHSTDIVRFIPIHLGDATDGTFEWYFNGLDVGLDEKGEVIDAIAFTPDGKLLISTIGGITVPGVTANDEDLAQFDAAQLGQTTAGTWSLYFDGSDVGLSNAGSEEITGAWIDPDTGKIYLSTLGDFAVAGVFGDANDIFVCTPISLGDNTACTFDPYLFWDGGAAGLGGNPIDAMDINLNPAPPPPPPTPCPSGPVRIMPLGASYTMGYASTDLSGYRRRLYLKLAAEGYSVDFVGGMQDGPTDFDRDHEGHPGWHAEGSTGGGVAPNIYNWLVANPADVILLHIGTNDISEGGQDPAEVGRILDEIDRYDPNITVVLAMIINRKTYSPETTEFNQGVRLMAEARIANGDKIVIVDMENALIYPDDMFDNTHPNDVGYAKTADVWLEGLRSFLPKCR